MGWFEMGSTIVLVFEAPVGTQFHVSEGSRVLLGQELVTMPGTSSQQLVDASQQ
jgi:hypothetical protein